MDGGTKEEQTEMVRDTEAERELKRTRGLMNRASHDTAAFSSEIQVHLCTRSQTKTQRRTFQINNSRQSKQ